MNHKAQRKTRLSLVQLMQRRFPNLAKLPYEVVEERINGRREGIMPAHERILKRTITLFRSKTSWYVGYKFDEIKEMADLYGRSLPEETQHELKDVFEQMETFLLRRYNNPRYELSKDHTIRDLIEMLDYLTFQDSFFLIASHQPTVLGIDQSIREKAIERLTHEYKLVDLAQGNYYPEVKPAALAKLESRIEEVDPNALSFLAIESQDPSLRRRAIDRLDDEFSLREVCTYSTDQEIKALAMNKLIQNIYKLQNSLFLCLRTMDSNNQKVRQILVQKIERKEDLQFIANFSRYEDARNAAREKLKRLADPRYKQYFEEKREKDERLFHALQDAFHSRDLQEAANLLEQGAPTEILDYPMNPPLLSAAKEGHLDFVKLLIKHGAMIDFKDQESRTPLFEAVGNGQEEVAEYLLNAGADPHYRNRYDETPLIYAAAYGGTTRILQMLLDHGADLHAKDDRGWSAYIVATYCGQHKKAEFLRQKGSHTPEEEGNYDLALLLAAASGNNEKITEFIDKGANVNPPREQGLFPLRVACEGSSLETVRLLLDSRANPYLTSGIDPLLIQTITYRADAPDKTKVLHLLLDRMIELGPDSDGQGALFQAVGTGDIKLIDYVLDKGENIDAKDNEGMTALMRVAQKHSHDYIVKHLLSKGADHTIEDNEGRTAKDHAKSKHVRETAKLLEEYEQQKPVTKEALLEELKNSAGGYVFSKYPNSSSYEVIERFSGENTSKEISRRIVNFSLGRTNIGPNRLPQSHDVQSAEVEAVYLGTVGDYTFFGMVWESVKSDSAGRKYVCRVNLLLPSENAENLIEYIKKDPKFITELYKGLFPESQEANPIKLASTLSVFKDWEEIMRITVNPS
jgi:ankyrin repeat protein